MADLPDVPSGLVSRRSVIGLGVAGLGALATTSSLSGCSNGTSPAGQQATPQTSVTPDVRTATEALTAIRSTRQAVRATVQAFPATRTRLTPLLAMHDAHERSLVRAVPAGERSSTAPAPYAVPRRRDPALARLQVAEGRLHDALQGLSLKAESGEFARLLASMAAGVTVHRTVLATGRA